MQIANRRAIARNGKGRDMGGARLRSEAGNSDESQGKHSTVHFLPLGDWEYTTYGIAVVIA